MCLITFPKIFTHHWLEQHGNPNYCSILFPPGSHAAIIILKPELNRTLKGTAINPQWNSLLPRTISSFRPRPSNISNFGSATASRLLSCSPPRITYLSPFPGSPLHPNQISSLRITYLLSSYHPGAAPSLSS